MSRDVWACVSDLHCGSTLGLCPSTGARLDDGGHYSPSQPQLKLWACWLDYWQTVGAALLPGDRLYVALNGDLVDGDHHKTAQIITKNLPATQHNICIETLAPMLALEPAGIAVIRGTEAHVGGSGSYEERIAHGLSDLGHKTICPSTGYSHWHFQALSGGVMLDFAHHGSVGRLPHTRLNALGTLSMRITNAAANSGQRIPDVAIRSHMHQWGDTGDNFRTRVLQMGAWQLSTAYVHRIHAGAMPEIGGAIIVCEKGEAGIRKVKYPWKREEPWATASSLT